MDYKMKKYCREKIKNEGWHRLGIIDDDPSSLLWGKNVMLMYENMDGDPCVCTATYIRDDWSKYFRAVDGPAKGNRMANLIAYKEIGE